MLSQTAEYALRAAIRLARPEGGGPVSVDALSAELDIPRNYLSKILHALAREGVVESVRGPGGGFRLAASPASTPLLRVVGVFDDVSPGRTCIMGRDECSDVHPCPVHERWVPASEAIARFFRETSLADVADAEGVPGALP